MIDRAFTMLIDRREWPGLGSEMAVAARVAGCARRIRYPDMNSVLLRVMAARPSEPGNASGDRGRHVTRLLEAAVPLALVDPAAARVVLDQVEARGGLDPVTMWQSHEPWLIAWSLVDLDKARTVFEAEMAEIDRRKLDAASWSVAFYQMVEVLTAPADRREKVLASRSGGGYWSPDQEF